MVIDGKIRSLYRRSFCLECSPFGDHNTSKVPLGLRSAAEAIQARRDRRREQFRQSLRKRRRKRKADLVAAYGGRCVDCGYATCPEALQFHHRDPSTKEFRLGHFNGSLARLIEEAAKCDLVCANCHRIRHAREAAASRHRIVQLRRDIKRRAIELFGGLCLSCGSAHAPAALEFHHPDPSKKEFAISVDGIYRSWETVKKELENCVMLCANCHAEIHAGVRVLDLALHPTLERPTVAAS
ncbi:MAG TPA: HNH endonuclease signature motif containing protein [Candidatus Polarisedimenticolia bacterium]|nr:HNH endonuclease signature motif containing protein [Candidatus Polarisedimenticolia bacterium]